MAAASGQGGIQALCKTLRVMAFCHFLNVLKPSGPTSFAVVARVRRIAGTKRVGHLGTLDPMARGVLPLALGTATRLIEYVSGDKRYLAEVTLGIATDTLDAEGQVVARADASLVSLEQAESVLAEIAARATQVPPLVSALHHEGKRLYEHFRAGRTVEVPPRPVRIDAIEVVAFEPPRLTIDVRCGAGTYIRSIARDLGEALGCGAHLSALARTRHGPFSLETAVSLERLESDGVAPHLVPPRAVVDRLGWLAVGPEDAAALRQGKGIGVERVEDPGGILRDPGEGRCALADLEGTLVAIAALRASTLHPLKVFAGPEGELT
jgi:tRNA pseudouridine55 synthase